MFGLANGACVQVLPRVEPWPRNNLPWGLTAEFLKLGASLVVEDPADWDRNRIILTIGSRVLFKFVHTEFPLLPPVCHLYDYKVRQ